jgi:hypothetical protein
MSLYIMPCDSLDDERRDFSHMSMFFVAPHDLLDPSVLYPCVLSSP